MDKLKSIIAYFCLRYPHGDELSKARLTKMVYLADWLSALVTGRQMTEIKWIFNHYGPYVDDVMAHVSFDPDFKITHNHTIYGGDKHVISYHGNSDICFEPKEQEILDFIINKTATMYFKDFINYVYSTYPVTSSERYSDLELEEKAREYRDKEQLSLNY